MMSQEVNFAALKQRVPLEAVLRHYQVDDLRGGHSGRYRGRCPIHQGEGRDAFHVDVKRKIFHCFSCRAGGDMLDLVALLSNCTLRQAALQLQDWFPGAASGEEPPTKQRVTKGNISVNPALKFTLRGVDGGHAYVATREVNARTAARFGVGFYRGPGLMSGRVVIPIHDERGRLVAYAGRSVDGSEPRYRFPAGFGKSQVLFNFHRATATTSDTVLVVEGFFDCMRVSQAGFGTVVALMGTELYEHPAQLLHNRFSRVVLMLDGDEAGRLARDRVAGRLRDTSEVRVIELPEGRQPDQLPECRLRELIESAERVIAKVKATTVA
jgi:DNA primase